MQITEKIETLFKKCKCSVTITYNNHKDGYETVDTYITNLKQNSIIDNDDIELDILEKMKELDTIIEIQFYPDTPIGSYTIYLLERENPFPLGEGMRATNLGFQYIV